MPTIQHRDIADTESHEPKNISTATAGQVYVADGASSGEWAKLTPSQLDHSDKTTNITGWNLIADSQYTSGSPRAITATTKTLITNNTLGGVTDETRLGAIWDDTNSKFLINDANASYLLRVTCKIVIASGNPFFTWELEGGSPAALICGDQRIGVTGTVPYTVVMPFTLSTGINNTDIKLYLTPSADVSLHSVFFHIQRLYKET